MDKEKVKKSFSDRLLNSVAAQHRAGMMRRAFVAVFICLFALFSTSKLWYQTTPEDRGSPIGTKVGTSSAISVVLKEWVFNPDTNFLEGHFSVVCDESNYSTELKFSPYLEVKQSDSDTPVPIQCDVAYSDDEVLIIKTSQLPGQWKRCRLFLADNSAELASTAVGTVDDALTESQVTSSESEPEYASTAIICDRNSVHNNTALKEQSKQSYAVLSVQSSMTDTKEKIINAKSLVRKNNESVKTINKDIAAIKQDEKYQTPDELMQSKQLIDTKKSTIAELQKQNQELSETIEKQEAKLKKLEQKLQDIKKGKVK